MRVGLMLPTMRSWFGREAIARVCALAGGLGYSSLWLGDHVVAPTQGPPEKLRVEPVHRWQGAPPDPETWPTATQYFGERFLDVYITWMHLLDRTTRLRVGSNIVVLPYRNPLVQAKMLAALDELSGGRTIFGIGSGHVAAESEALGVSYEDRGAMTDEWLRLIVLCLTEEEFDFEGRWFSFRGLRPLTQTVQKPHPPILVGGNSRRSIRRAAELGQGWHPSDLTPAEIQTAQTYLGAELARTGRGGSLPISLHLFLRLVPESAGEPYRGRLRLTAAETVDLFRTYEAVGVAEIAVFLPTFNLDVYLDQVRQLGQEVVPAVGGG